eukprot:TRINITY_DN7662_c0_g1_i1.p1 TRINITY_DN7662_c0_g1~~TRINITY_DN7662_c0_g1_i1.p1  ORF type:complete len:1229 (-),score=294.03 TRINITY_DN7662_c0_g1_i1:161-3820(-)
MAALKQQYSEEVLAGDAALVSTADHLYQALKSDQRLEKFFAQVSDESLVSIATSLRLFLSQVFNEEQWPSVRCSRGMFDKATIGGLVEVTLEAVQKPSELGQHAMDSGLKHMATTMKEDPRVQNFFGTIHALIVEDSEEIAAEVEDPTEMLVEEEEEGGEAEGQAFDSGGLQVNTTSLEPMNMSQEQAVEVQTAWSAFLDSYSSREVAGEAIYGALFDSAPSLQNLFKTPRAVMSLRFMLGIQSIIMALQDGQQVKYLVEALGFQHLDLEVTVPRIAIFRDAILDLIRAEMGKKATPLALEGISKALNYAGGGYIYIRTTYASRLKILASSWRVASGKDQVIEDEEEAAAKAESAEVAEGAETAEGAQKEGEGVNDVQKSSQEVNQDMMGNQGVPTTYDEMFRFNAAVMGFAKSDWMYAVLDSFDAIVANVANSQRLGEECDVLCLKFAKIKGEIKLPEYKAVMLASLRSLVPKDWDSDHEVAWNWLWDNVEKLLEKGIGLPNARERRLARFLGSVEESTLMLIRQGIYSKFFALAPGGQDYFKQSTTRLYAIADKVLEMTLDMYKYPAQMVEDISALGLRHVGYGIPTEFMPPFVVCTVEVVKELTEEEELATAFGWSLDLVSRILIRTINEGSTIVMKAINANNIKQVKKALACAPRIERASWMLSVTVGTQSISPLIWSINSGASDAARVIIVDLLTIRADRDRYYYGVDELFDRHPDIVQILCENAQDLLPCLLDGLIWRSKVVTNGYRRVNIYLRHLLVDAEGEYADAMNSLAKMGDPRMVMHGVLTRLTDLVWTNVIYTSFLRSKVWLLISLLVFLTGQAIINNLHGGHLNATERILTFVCRAFVYAFSMTELIYTRTKVACLAMRLGNTTTINRIPVPKRWVQDWREAVSLLLSLTLAIIFFQEPIFYCLQAGDDFEGHGMFTQECPDADSVKSSYSVLSGLAMLFYFTLLVDFSALSVRLSAFVLLITRVLPELGLFLLAFLYAVLAFGSSITANSESTKEFKGIPKATLSLFEIAINMFPGEAFDTLQEYGWTLSFCLTFSVVLTVLFMNLLAAQLNCAYMQVYSDMVGYARMSRMTICVEKMPAIPKKRFHRFVEGLKLDDRLEFGEGDIGLAGGIQVLEPSHENPTNQDSIKRFGGSTSVHMQWPEEDEETQGTGYDRLEKTLQRVMASLSRRQQKKGSRGGSSSMDQGSSNVKSEGDEDLGVSSASE